MGTTILVILISLILSAFFSGMEIAFLSSNKLRLEIERKKSRTYDYIAGIFTRHPGQYISTILVGNNIALVIYSLFMSALYNRLTGSSNYFIETFISTLIIIFTAEFLPKAVVRANPNWYLHAFATPAYFFYILFYPISRLASLLSSGFLRLAGVRLPKGQQAVGFDKVDLAHLVEESQREADNNPQTAEDNENRIKLFQNALEFSEGKVRECMVPRTDIEAIDIEGTVDDIRRLFISSGYSRLAVFDGNVDNIIGYVSLKALFNDPQTIRDILQQTIYVPETMLQQKLLSEFIKSHRSMAVVIDEFGSTAGMVTLEDLLEQIFGEIEDEHDADYLVEKEIGTNEYILAGRLEIEHLNDTYKLGIPESDKYDTLAGYILRLSEDIPQNGDIIRTDQLKIKVLRTSHNRIDLVQLTRF